MTGLITEPLGNEVFAHFDGKRITLVKKEAMPLHSSKPGRTIAFIVLDADMLERFASFLQLMLDAGQGPEAQEEARGDETY